MSKSSILRKIILSNWFLALIPSLIISYFLPSPGVRYKIDIDESGRDYASYCFVDLDSDGVTESLRPGKGFPYYHVLVMDNEFRVHDQWNFRDTLYLINSKIFFGNYDNDRFQEIYAFTFKDDSLFLNINEFFDRSGLKSDRLFITTIGIVNNTVTSNTNFAGFYDVTGDGFKELYFTIQTGFGLQPRLIYYYDIAHNKLKSSDFTGLMFQNPEFVDTDGDGKPEIFGLIAASGNYKTPTPFTDRSTWLMVYDENLNFEFPPVEFPGMTNGLTTYAYKTGNVPGYVVSHNTGSADTSVLKPRIMIFSLNGKKIRERLYSEFGFGRYTCLKVLNDKKQDRIFVFDKDIVELNVNLDIVNKIKSPFDSFYSTFLEDFNNDGLNEFVLFSEKDEHLVLFNSSLKKIAETHLKATAWDMKFSHSVSGKGDNKIFLTSENVSYFLILQKKNMFFLGYLMYPGAYLLCLLFILLIRRINTFQVVEKESLKQRLVTLQLQAIKSQLDPHFTFNTLNSVASLIYLEDRQSAYDYMNKFTQMLRVMLKDAEKIYRSLGEEIDFVTTYLDLEKLRFGDKFNYYIEIGEEVSQKVQVPKLVLQTFAENAIKHGLMPRSDGGILKISAQKEGNCLRLTVEDNGIGRSGSAGMSSSTGKGLKLTNEFYDILNQINKVPIRHVLTDLFDEYGNPSGTRAVVWVPVIEEL